MDTAEVRTLIQGLVSERGIPRRIRDQLEASLGMLDDDSSPEEKASHILSILDEAANDPNVSPAARTKIWSLASVLEKGEEKQEEKTALGEA